MASNAKNVIKFKKKKKRGERVIFLKNTQKT